MRGNDRGEKFAFGQDSRIEAHFDKLTHLHSDKHCQPPLTLRCLKEKFECNKVKEKRKRGEVCTKRTES